MEFTYQELQSSIDRRVDEFEKELAEKYEPILHAKDMEILSLKMSNESLSKENEMIWQTSLQRLAEERVKVKELQDRLEQLLGAK